MKNEYNYNCFLYVKGSLQCRERKHAKGELVYPYFIPYMINLSEIVHSVSKELILKLA